MIVGVAIYWAAPQFPFPLRLIMAGDAFFLFYLSFMAFVVFRISAVELCERAANEDEGIFLTVAIALAVIVSCCVAIFTLLNQVHKPPSIPLALALVSAPLGWLTLHTIAAFHYANLYYAPSAREAGVRALEFPGSADPNAWDFLYYSFVVGMTAQVSDVQVRSTKLRRATLGHGIVSFFYNTVLIAMAVNAVVALAA